MIAFSFAVAVLMAAVYYVCAAAIPMVYNTEPEIRALATVLMRITAIAMPFEALMHAAYFTIRSGGKMMITIVFDSGYMWGITVLLAFILSRYTAMPFVTLFAIIQGLSALKSIMGLALVKNGFWIRNIIA